MANVVNDLIRHKMLDDLENTTPDVSWFSLHKFALIHYNMLLLLGAKSVDCLEFLGWMGSLKSWLNEWMVRSTF